MRHKNNSIGINAKAFLASIIVGSGNVHAVGLLSGEVDATCANTGNDG